jgi:2-polyprenyl-3-methyl-5-hydroxy-6-metoxy-1,4-benzoquinol methylase
MFDYKDKPSRYYEAARKDLASEVPVGTHAVLEVGCGRGGTGALLKSEGRAQWVTGIELMEDAAQKAKGVLDEVLIGNVENMDLPFVEGQFDAMIFGDVLEHLVDPWRVLEKLVTFLKPQGLVIASLPNVRNWRVLLPLLFLGRWDYKELGVMDRTHLRFFTRDGMIKLFHGSNLEIKSLTPLGERSLVLSRLPIGPLKEFIVPQYILVGIRTVKLAR